MKKQKEQVDLFDWEPKDNFDHVNIEPTLPDIVIALYSHSGFSTLYWRLGGYQTINIDQRLGMDIFEWDYKNIDRDRVIGIMAFPPCTHFSLSGAQYWEEKDEDGRTEEAVELVEKALEIKDHFDPNWWFFENPVGRINDLVPELGDPFYFHPYEYGDPWKKKTALFGKFKPPVKNPVEPYQMIDKNGKKYSVIHWKTGGTSDRTKLIRSLTPKGFAKAFYKANSNH